MQTSGIGGGVLDMEGREGYGAFHGGRFEGRGSAAPEAGASKSLKFLKVVSGHGGADLHHGDC